MRAFAVHLGLDVRMGLRNSTLMLMNYLFPLGVYALLGALMSAVNPGFVTTIIPAMTLFAIMSAALLGMPDTIVSARTASILRSYKINGVPASSLLAIPVLTSTVHALIVSLVIALTAPFVFGADTVQNPAGFLLVFLASAFALAGAGALIGVVSSSTRMTVLLSQAVFLPSMILGGLMLPTSALPEPLAQASRLLPTTHAMDAFAALAMGQASPTAWWSLGVLLTGGAIAAGLAVLLFSWDARNATRRAPVAWAALAMVPYLAATIVSIVTA